MITSEASPSATNDIESTGTFSIKRATMRTHSDRARARASPSSGGPKVVLFMLNVKSMPFSHAKSDNTTPIKASDGSAPIPRSR
jgi:hypothetical protein